MCPQQALAVFREHRGHPHRILHGQADEPAVQQVVLHLLHKLAFRAHAVEHLEQHGAQQLLGRDAGPPAFAVGLVHPGKQRVHFCQRLVDHLAYRAQRMVGRHKVLQAVQREGNFGEGVGSAHGSAGFVSGWEKGSLRLSGEAKNRRLRFQVFQRPVNHAKRVLDLRSDTGLEFLDFVDKRSGGTARLVQLFALARAHGDVLAHIGVGIGALVSALYPVSIPVEISLVKNLINQFKTLTSNKM